MPGIEVCEHLPKTAEIMDKLTILRSVDCSASNHTPITMQAGNPLAQRTDDGKDGGGYPSMGSIVARFRGSNHPAMPAFVGLAEGWKADIWESGHMGNQYAPVNGAELAGRFALPKGVAVPRLWPIATSCAVSLSGCGADSIKRSRLPAPIAINSRRSRWCRRAKLRARSTSSSRNGSALKGAPHPS